jgi:hypothetical protein
MKARLVLTSLSALCVEEITGGLASQPLRAHPEEPLPAALPAPVDPDALPHDSASSRERLLRRYEEPYPIFWIHGGLNE